MASIAAIETIGKAWTHPKTGAVRYYINADKIAEMAGISEDAYGREGRSLSKAQYGKLMRCKFWLDAEGELHIDGSMPEFFVEGTRTAEDLIREAISEAIADKTETTDEVAEEIAAESSETAASYELRRNVDEPDYYPRAKVAELVADGEIVGGENGEEDIIQIAKDGVLWQVFCDTHWDDIPEDLDDITEHAVGLTCDFSVGRWNAPKVVEHPYTFAHYNGNVGEDVGFDTLEEAEKAARDKWAHLTDSEKARYSKPGSYFIVAEGDTTDGYNDVLDLTEEDESRIDEWTGTLKVKGHGNSLILTITEAVRLMGLSLGDVVEVQIRRR